MFDYRQIFFNYSLKYFQSQAKVFFSINSLNLKMFSIFLKNLTRHGLKLKLYCIKPPDSSTNKIPISLVTLQNLKPKLVQQSTIRISFHQERQCCWTTLQELSMNFSISLKNRIQRKQKECT